jgi:hypothetical protein
MPFEGGMLYERLLVLQSRATVKSCRRGHASMGETMTKVLQTKVGESTGELLYRYVNADDAKDLRKACWYSTEIAAARAWTIRWPDES